MKNEENVVLDILKLILVIPLMVGWVILGILGWIAEWFTQPKIKMGICPECGEELKEKYDTLAFRKVECPNKCLKRR